MIAARCQFCSTSPRRPLSPGPWRRGAGEAQTGARRGTVTIVVCYHAVSATWPSALAVSESLLAAQLSVLARRGYVGLTLEDAERRRADGRLPRRTLVITFDDGYASTLRAKPILERLGFPATVFVV